MAPPSQLSIATSSVLRLLKEEASYRTELEGQKKRLQTLETESHDDEEGNRAWNIGQEVLTSTTFLLLLRMYIMINDNSMLMDEIYSRNER